MDVESYRRWWDYTRAYDDMIRATDSRHAPWWIVPSNDKKRARINCISHILASIPYERVKFDEPKLGKRQKRPDGFKADTSARNVVPDVQWKPALRRAQRGRIHFADLASDKSARACLPSGRRDSAPTPGTRARITGRRSRRHPLGLRARVLQPTNRRKAVPRFRRFGGRGSSASYHAFTGGAQFRKKPTSPGIPPGKLMIIALSL